MIEPRSITDTQREIYRLLSTLNSPLTDQSPGSVLYSLTRCFAGVALVGDQLLFQLASRLHPSTASGSDLDDLAANFGVHRRLGERARGYVLVRSLDRNLTIRPGTAFTHPRTHVQYLVEGGEDGYYLPEEVEMRLPVAASRAGAVGNTPAGTALVYLSSASDAIEVVVGSYRSVHGHPVGDIKGGADTESDEALRIRLFKHLQTRNSCSEAGLLSEFLNDPRVRWATVELPFRGYIRVWVELNAEDTSRTVNDLQRLAEDVRPVGATISVHAVKIQQVEFVLRAYREPGQDRDELTEQLTQAVQRHCRQLPFGQPLVYRRLRNELESQHPVRLIAPASDVFPLAGHVLRPDPIEVRFQE